MKKFLVTALAAAASAAAFAGMGNIAITFSTPGPDTYADGAPVRDGERYALVWTPTGSTFAGINANGTAAGDSVVVASVPVAEGGRCPPVFFQVDEGVVEANYKGGTWSVCLLDTRVFALDADGKPVIGADGFREVASHGAAGVANGYGVVGEAKVVEGGATGASAGGVAAASGEVASDTPAPVISGISFDGDNVLIKVSGTKPAYKYALSAGDAPDAIAAGAGDPDSYGSATKDIILVKPKKSGGEFFKVNCK